MKPTTCQLIRLDTGLYGRNDIAKAPSMRPERRGIKYHVIDHHKPILESSALSAQRSFLSTSVHFNILFKPCSDSNSLRCSLLASRLSSRRPHRPTITKTVTATTFGGAAKVVVCPNRYGGIRGVIVPPKHHCGRWYWHSSLGYCVPPQPDWSDPQCPAGWRWDDGAYSCVPSAPSLPDSGYGTGGVSIGQCGPSYFWWGPRSFCLAIGGPSVLPAVPNGWACPSNWYWHGNGFCVPREIGYGSNPVCGSSYRWDAGASCCKRGY
ncbi:hypothetical protein RHS03_00778, partial [Rhizoctonia solani]